MSIVVLIFQRQAQAQGSDRSQPQRQALVLLDVGILLHPEPTGHTGGQFPRCEIPLNILPPRRTPLPPGDRHFTVLLGNIYCGGLCCPSVTHGLALLSHHFKLPPPPPRRDCHLATAPPPMGDRCALRG